MKKKALWVSVLLTLTVSASALADASSKAPKSATEWKAGYEYNVLIPSEAPEGLPAETVEVRELFLYTSGWSKAIQPYLQKWLESKGDRVRFIRQPAIAYPHAREQARMYYTLKALGREDLHLKFFDFVREEHRYDVYHTISRPATDAIKAMGVTFAKRNGLTSKDFIETYSSWEIEDQVISAGIASVGYALRGTSTVVVNDRFSTSLQRFLAADPACADRGPQPADYERFFQLIDELIVKALKEEASATPAAPSAPKS